MADNRKPDNRNKPTDTPKAAALSSGEPVEIVVINGVETVVLLSDFIEQGRLLRELEDSEETLKEEYELTCLEREKLREQLVDVQGTDQIYLFNVITHDLRAIKYRIQYLVARIDRARTKTDMYAAATGLERTFETYDALIKMEDR